MKPKCHIRCSICLLLIRSCYRDKTIFLGSSFQISNLHNSSPSDMYKMSCMPFHWPSWCLLRSLVTKYFLHHHDVSWRSVTFSIWLYSASLINSLRKTHFEKNGRKIGIIVKYVREMLAYHNLIIHPK